ncbi:MAG TPA: sugar phosphate isomerase/epimerase family protein [Ohtaekwangia sp.]
MYRILLFVFLYIPFTLGAQTKIRIPEIGIVQSMQNDSLLYSFGYRCLVESTPKVLSPRTVSAAQFEANLHTIKKLTVPLLACNILIPGDLKLVGPQADETALLSYLEEVFKRAQAASIRMFTWGSGGSRRIPEGYDREKAKQQFISTARKITVMAAKYDITLALENLNSTETNFINTVQEAFDIVQAIDHPNLRLCVDIYHMLKEGESPDIILRTKPYTIYCEVAEKEGRTPPGVHGDDFIPYFIALKKIGYTGKIVIECQWQYLASQGNMAYQTLHQQIKTAFN